jgi:hypothetical protein
MPHNGFNWFIRLCVNRKEVEILLNEEFLYAIMVRDSFGCYPGSDCSDPAEELPSHDTCLALSGD